VNFLYKWLKKKLREADDNYPSLRAVPSTPLHSKLRSDGVQFTVYKADGGYAVEVCTYDERYQGSSTNLYLITPDQNFGERIAHILTFEAIKH